MELDYAGVGAMLRGPLVSADLSDRAERVAERARQLAPAEPRYDEYRNAVAVAMRTTDRRSAVVRVDLSYAMNVEAAHRILGIALDAANG